MPRWKDIPDDELDARTIYTGAYGFEHNDALGRVWGHTPKQWEAAMRSAYSETARMYASEYESEYQIRNQLWYVGPFEMTVSDVVEDLEEPSRADELRDDIRASSTGYVY